MAFESRPSEAGRLMDDALDAHIFALRSYLAVISGYTQLVHRAYLSDTNDTAETVRRTEAVLRAVEQLAGELDALEDVLRRAEGEREQEREGQPP